MSDANASDVLELARRVVAERDHLRAIVAVSAREMRRVPPGPWLRCSVGWCWMRDAWGIEVAIGRQKWAREGELIYRRYWRWRPLSAQRVRQWPKWARAAIC